MKKFFPLAVLALAGVLLSININKPFIGQHDWNGAVYGQQAKNFVRFGYLPLRFGATLATADTLADERKFSAHYTPVLPILISFSYRLFGVSEWSIRLVPVIASLISVFLVILLGKELISYKAGIIAGTLMTVTPMFIYYGKNPVHEVVLLPFALFGFYSYWRWRRSRERKWWMALVISLAAAMLIGWSGYYAAGLIAIYGFLTEKHSRSKFLLLPVLMAGLFLIFLIHQSILNPEAGEDLAKIATARVTGGGFGFFEFISRELRYAINLFTIVNFGLSAIWLTGFLVKVLFCHCEERSDAAISSGSLAITLLACVGLFGISHVLLFRDAGWYHEYLLFPLMPFLVLAAAAMIERRSILVILAVVVLTAVERVGYAKALLNSEYVRDIYGDAVEFAKQKRWENERIPEERDVYFIFYADRENI